MRTKQTFQFLGLLLLGTLAIASAQDVSKVLAQYPKFSKFNELLKSTGVLTEINMRSTMTILLPEDGVLNGYIGSHPSYTTQMVADVLRYHCLLQYFGSDELKTLDVNGAVVTTLYQTTGRANGLDGFVNVTAQPDGSITVGPSTPPTPAQATLITNVTQYPYNYSFYQISGVLEPIGLAAAQLAPTTPPSVAPVPAPMAPVETPVEAPVYAPVSSPASVPAMAPIAETPVSEPVSAPVEAPVEAPVAEVPAPVPEVPAPVAEVPAPVAEVPVPSMATPVPAPAEIPVKAPVVAPFPPLTNGPAVNGPMESPVSSAFYMRFNAAAMVSSAFVLALLL